MHINVGDKLVATKNVSSFFNEGDIVEVVNVNENMVSFACSNSDTENHIRIARSGQMDIDTCSQYFTKLEEEKETIAALEITEEYIAEIMENSEFETHTVFDKCTIVSCRLPNGFVITESSSCVDLENYDAELAEEICLDKIAEKIWELEAYRLQQFLWEEEGEEDDYCTCCCGNCEECEYDDEDELDECLDTDLDCDDCEDFECPYNSNHSN